MSKEELARTTPVTPPKEKRKMKPRFHKVVTFHSIFVPKIVANQEKILIPVGMAIIMVAVVK